MSDLNKLKATRVWLTGKNIDFASCGNIGFWVEDFTGENYVAAEPVYDIRVKNNVSIHYIISGSGYFMEGGEMKRLSAGDAFLIIPFTKIAYYPDGDEPWCYCGISSDSAALRHTIETVGYNDSAVLPKEKAAQIGRLLTEIISLNSVGRISNLHLSSVWHRIIAYLNEQKENKSTTDYVKLYISTAFEYMKENMGNPNLKIEDVSKAIGISHSHLCRIFKEHTQKTAKAQLVEMRLKAAYELLEKGDISVTEAAYSVGFTDVAHFSKVFKRHYNASPASLKP